MMKRFMLFPLITLMLVLVCGLAYADVTASFQQTDPQAGAQLDLDWNVTGGTAPYSVQVEWRVQESCLTKTMQTDTVSGASGTVSYNVPGYVDQVTAFVIVTDSTGNTWETQCYTSLSNWVHQNEASFGVHNGADYAYVGDTVSGTWQINAGRHTISNVRYKWVIQDGNHGLMDLTSWTSAGSNLTGSASYTTTQSGSVYLNVAFDGEDGWYCQGGIFDPIQVLNQGEVPLAAEISITPANPKPGDPLTIEWDVTGAGANPYIWIEWTFNSYSGTTDHGVQDWTTTSGTQSYTPAGAGVLNVWVHATNNDNGAKDNKYTYVNVEDATSAVLTLTNQQPQINRYLGFTREMEEEDGVFSWNALSGARIGYDLYQRLEAIYGGSPSWSVQQTAGVTLPISWSVEQNGRAVDVRLEAWDLANYQPGTAEITITCSWGDQTATAVTQVNILDLPNGAPSGIDYNSGSDTVECQVGDTLMITPSILPSTWGGISGYDPHYAGNSGEFEEFCDIVSEGDWGREVKVTQAGYYQCFVGVGIDTITAGRWITYKVKDENGNLPAPELEFDGYFSYTEGVDLDQTGEFYVANNLPLDVDDDEVLYSISNLFCYGIDNWWQIGDYVTGTPSFSVRQTSGNVKYREAVWNDQSHIDVYLTEMPAAGSAEFEVSCTVDGQTYVQSVKVNFVTLSGRPSGVEIGYSNPMIAKCGDKVDFNPNIWFKNNWSVGQLTWSLYGDGDFWDAVTWDNSAWNKSGTYTMQMIVACDNIRMNKTIKVIVTESDGTMKASDYVPFGTVTVLPNDLKTVESQAFVGTQLTEVDIPAGVSIASDAFDGTGLMAVFTHNDPNTINWAVGNGIIALTE